MVEFKVRLAQQYPEQADALWEGGFGVERWRDRNRNGIQSPGQTGQIGHWCGVCNCLQYGGKSWCDHIGRGSDWVVALHARMARTTNPHRCTEEVGHMVAESTRTNDESYS